MSSIEAIWSIYFMKGPDTYGAGVAVFETQRIFGGDSNYYYVGSYAVQGSIVTGTVNVRHYTGDLNNVFGPLKELEIDFEVEKRGDEMNGAGVAKGIPGGRLVAKLKRLADLP